MELRDKGKNGFLLPPELIIPTGEQARDQIVKGVVYSVRAVPVNKEKIEDTVIGFSYPVVESCLGLLINVNSWSNYILPMSTLRGLPLTPSLRLLRE